LSLAQQLTQTLSLSLSLTHSLSLSFSLFLSLSLSLSHTHTHTQIHKRTHTRARTQAGTHARTHMSPGPWTRYPQQHSCRPIFLRTRRNPCSLRTHAHKQALKHASQLLRWPPRCEHVAGGQVGAKTGSNLAVLPADPAARCSPAVPQLVQRVGSQELVAAQSAGVFATEHRHASLPAATAGDGEAFARLDFPMHRPRPLVGGRRHAQDLHPPLNINKPISTMRDLLIKFV
jgi:hypothetical protein